MHQEPSKPNLLDLTFEELQAFFKDMGEKPFRAAQINQWLWQKGARDFEAMTNVSKELRAKLAERAAIVWPAIETVRESSDGTAKFLLRLSDGETVETVLIPEKGHFTQCLSSQVGCAMGCTFCSTGLMGYTRNMTMGEILGQILVARAWLVERGESRPLRNLVFMGMGEPLMNLDNLLKSLRALHHPEGLNFSGRRVTVSTVGLRKGLEALGEAGLAGLAILAVSLHAPTQELREKIMPAAAKAAPLPELMAALDRYPLKPRQRVTYEYIMLKGVNDSPKEARELVKLLGQRKAKVNLIVFNPSPDLCYEAPDQATVLAFERILWDRGMNATIRRSRGQDIDAACGQLRVAYEGMGEEEEEA